MSSGVHVKSFDAKSFPAQPGAERPLLLDFSASWCGPCRLMAPTVDALAETYQGRADVGVVDIDQSPELAARFGVTAVPTFVLLKGGQVVERLVGAVPPAALSSRLEQLL